MSRILLLALLGVSLAANVWLALRAPHSTATPERVANAPAARPTAPDPAAPSPARLLATDTPRSAADLQGVAAELRAAGLPEALVQRVLQAMITEEFSRRRRAIYDFAAIPFWKTQAPNSEQSRALRALERERREMAAALGLPRSPEEIAARRRQFGDIPESKIAAIEKVQQDYNDLRQDIFEQQRTASARGQNIGAQMKLIEEEFQRDLATLLSPEEKLEYDLRSSETANRLRGQLRSLDLSEQEYRSLFTAQRAYESVTFVEGARTAEQLATTVQRWDQLQTTARGALGDERYRQYLISSQFAGRGGDSFFTERANLTVDQIQAIARMNTTISADMMREVNEPGLSADERRTRAAAVTRRYQEALTNLVGADAAKELQTRNIVSLPRPTAGGTVGLPAARLPGSN